MVNHIHFQRILPSLSNSKRVKRADRKNTEQNNSSFKRILKKDEHKEKNFEKIGGLKKNDQGKRIDIHA